MSEQSKIQWCDSTINFWSGCTKVSSGCLHCYAEARDQRHMVEKVDHWGKGAPRLKHKGAVKDALKLNRLPLICDKCGNAQANDTFCYADGCDGTSFHRRRIFSLSLGDWLDPEVPIEWLAEMLDTIRQCDRVTWILCTKRPELWSSRLREVLDWDWEQPHQARFSIGRAFHYWLCDWQARMIAPKNIWLLTSVENQQAADERIPSLLKLPAAVRGLSLEPLLGPVDLGRATPCGYYCDDSEYGHGHVDHQFWSAGIRGGIQWLIVGGESGPLARPCNVDWISSMIEQGKAAGTATFVKQLGSYPVTENANLHDWPDETEFFAWGQHFAGARARLKHSKGGDWNEWPEELRVRQFPAEVRLPIS